MVLATYAYSYIDTGYIQELTYLGEGRVWLAGVAAGRGPQAGSIVERMGWARVVVVG